MWLLAIIFKKYNSQEENTCAGIWLEIYIESTSFVPVNAPAIVWAVDIINTMIVYCEFCQLQTNACKLNLIVWIENLSDDNLFQLLAVMHGIFLMSLHNHVF